jgi:hypothetical protein
MAYKPANSRRKKWKKQNNPCPLVFIPRKPHKLGLEAFIAAVKNEEKKPFTIYIDPILEIGSPIDSLKKFVEFNQEILKDKILVCDAAFSSLELIKNLYEKNIFCIFSCNSNLLNGKFFIILFKLF